MILRQDTTEVDLNVTRNVLPELAKPDWDVLIFHYLGLDHIGHTGGPKRCVFIAILLYRYILFFFFGLSHFIDSLFVLLAL